MNKIDLKVSIIIPVFNAEKYLVDCLNSIISQKLKEIEILCIDDGSEDNSKIIIENFSKGDSRIKYYEYGVNRGQAYARNFGLNIASGRYIYFMDADDMLLENNAISVLYETAETEHLQGILFDAKPIFENDILRKTFASYQLHMRYKYNNCYSGEEIFREFMLHEDFHPAVWQQFWNATYIRESRLFFCEETSPHEDLLFSFEAMLLCSRIKHIPYELYIYRCRENSSTSGAFNLKRFYAYVVCYHEAIKFLSEYDFQRDTHFAIIQYLNGIKNILKVRAIEFLKEEIDILDTAAISNTQKLLLQSILTEKYSCLGRTFNVEEYKLLKNTSHIIVYGVGNIGQSVIKLLDEYGFSNYLLAVTENSGNEYTKNGTRIQTLEQLAQYSQDSLIVVSVTAKYQPDMIDNLIKLGFKKYICIA